MRAPEAGNTATSLTPIPVEAFVAAAAASNLPSAADLDAYVAEQETASVTAMHEQNAQWAAENPEAAAESGIVTEPTAEEIAEFENKFAEIAADFPEEETEYVTRAEFDELLARISHFNTRSGQHI